MKEHGPLPLREAIIQIAGTTDLKILICHEDETQMIIGKDWILDKLPEYVKQKCVWLNRNWLTDKAVSIYKRSAGLISNEMHLPRLYVLHRVFRPLFAGGRSKVRRDNVERYRIGRIII